MSRAAAFRSGLLLCASAAVCCLISPRAETAPQVPQAITSRAGGEPDASMSKQAKYDAMIALTQQMLDLRPRMTSDPAAAALHEQLQHAYRQLSESLGGDDPGRVLRGGRARQSAAARHADADDGGLAGGQPGCATTAFAAPSGVLGLAIPDVGTVTHVLNLSDAFDQYFICGFNVAIAIQHTYCADLDITLTSPSGTTVTLTTDNGGDLNNVFGTANFFDSANPGGTLPYATNNGLVTDHNYVNNTAAGVLVPEESFAAFNGESPAGNWTLSVTDDSANDTGTLNQWLLQPVFSSIPVTNQVTRRFANTTPINMPVPVALASSTINVAGMGGQIQDVIVHVDFSHTFNEDVSMALTSPSGRVITLTSGNGADNDNVFGFSGGNPHGTFFDDRASPNGSGKYLVTDATYANLAPKFRLTPEEALDGLSGTAPNGTWTLTIADSFPSSDGGSLFEWALTLTTGRCGNACASDINGDGLTNVDDLLGIINGWGNCP